MRSNIKKYIPLIVFSAIFLIFAITFSIIYFTSQEQTENGPIKSDEYIISSYNVDVNVNENNSYDIKENITADFLIKKHGIFRYLPIYQNVMFEEAGKIYEKNYKLSYTNFNLNCNDTFPLYDIYEDNGYLVIQIGSHYLVDIGEHDYVIEYTLTIGDDKILSFDQFYYNLISGWDTVIEDATINVEFEKPITENFATLYVGEYGTTEEEIAVINDNSFSFTCSDLPAYNGITAKVVLEEGYFTTQRASIIPDVLFLIGGIVILIFIVLCIWKKNNNLLPIPVVEFTAPKGMTPADVGYVIDRVVNKKDVASLIVYWANKGFIKIIDNGEEDLKLQKLKETDDTFKDYEKEIFNSLFDKKEIINLKDTNANVGIAINGAISSIYYENKEKNFSTERIIMRGLFVLLIAGLMFGLFAYLGEKLGLYTLNLGVSVIFAGIILLGTILMIVAKELKHAMGNKISLSLGISGLLLLLGSIIYTAILTTDSYSNPLILTIIIPILTLAMVYLILKINIRTEEGNKILGSLIGLKQFILVTEKDRIKILIKDDPTLFYDVLPYAYVLGVSDEWINKFEGLIVNAPDWYEGHFDGNLFFGLYILSTMNRFNSFYSRSLVKFNPNHSGGRGGFGGGFGSGGGFGGGGFGGGGGGSW